MALLPPEQPQSDPPAWWWKWAEIGLIVCIFYLSAAQPPPGVNEPHYLCRLRHAVDASYCPGDLFLESPDAHKTFVLAFAWLTRLLPLTAVAWIGRIGSWVALAWAWQRLSWTVVPRPLFSILGAGIVVSTIAKGNFAGEWLVGGFEAKTIAYVFVLLGLRAWVLNRWDWTWVHFGIASAWHALVGGWSVLILLKLWGQGFRQQQPFSGMLKGLALGGSIALAGVVPALALSMNSEAEVRGEAAEIYVFERLPHHLAPMHKPAKWVANRAGRHATIVIVFVALLFVRRHDVGGTWRMLRDDPAGRIAWFAVGAIVLTIIGLVIELALWDHPRQAAQWLRYYWFRLTDVAVPIGIAVLCIAMLAELLKRRSALFTAMLVGTMLVAGYPIAQQFKRFVQSPVAGSDALMRNVDDWLAACEWCRENTPTDALFLTPRGNASFKWHAERSEVVTYKDVPQNAESLVEWRRRLYEVFKPDGAADRDWTSSLGELGTPRIRELAGKYNAGFVLTTRDHPLGLPMVYANESYVVYQAFNND